MLFGWFCRFHCGWLGLCLVHPVWADAAPPSSRPVLPVSAATLPPKRPEVSKPSLPVSQRPEASKPSLPVSQRPEASKPSLPVSQRPNNPQHQPKSQNSPKVSQPPPVRQLSARLQQRNLATQRLVFQVSQLLGVHVQDFALDPNHPWLLAHALLALGPDTRLADNRLVLDVLVSQNLQHKQTGKLSLLGFPKGPKSQYIEAHPHLFLQMITQLNVPLDRKFEFQGQSITLRDIFNSALYQFPHQAEGAALARLSWLLLAMRRHTPENLWHWHNAQEQQVNLFRTMWRLFLYLDKQTLFLRTLHTQGAKEIPKTKLRNQFIYKEIYGGFYLMRAALAWLDHPLLRKSKKLQRFTEAQIELMFYRLRGESVLYQRLFEASKQNLGQRFLILMQQIRFTSHWLKTVVEAYHRKQIPLTPSNKRDIRQALQLLCISILILDRLGFFQKERLLRMKDLNPQSRRYVIDLIADAAHARHALILLQTAPALFLD